MLTVFITVLLVLMLLVGAGLILVARFLPDTWVWAFTTDQLERDKYTGRQQEKNTPASTT